MEKTRKYDISFFGEFVDKTLEKEFIDYDMRRNAKFIGPVTLIFGVIYMLFIIADYYAIESNFTFITILAIRGLVLVSSIGIYLSIKKIKNYVNIIYLISAHEIIAIVCFIVIIYLYKSFTYLTFFSVIVIALAVYIMPNRLINAQFISIFLILSFFIFPAKHIDFLEDYEILKILAYIIILIIFCNISTYLTNFYKRKQFADSRDLLRMSMTDAMTGIYTMAKLGEELNQWINYCNRYENPLSLIIFDVDDFKRVNDSYGHLTGDSVIRNIVTIIKDAIRNTDIFARWGGDEFVILLPNTDIHEALEMTERMRILIQKYKHDKIENITCSFGVGALKKDENAQSLIHRADKLLYDAKNCGKNAIACENSR